MVRTGSRPGSIAATAAGVNPARPLSSPGAELLRDSLAVGFEQDSIAGFNTDGTDVISHNPICVWRGSVSGVSESRPSSLVPRPILTATIIRGGLCLPIPSFTLHSSLFSLSGQKIMSPRPGSNDMSALAPGTYFIRQEGLGTRGWGSGKTTKVLKTK